MTPMTHRATGIVISWACGISAVSTAIMARILVANEQAVGAVLASLLTLLMLRLSFNMARAVERLYP